MILLLIMGSPQVYELTPLHATRAWCYLNTGAILIRVLFLNLFFCLALPGNVAWCCLAPTPAVVAW